MNKHPRIEISPRQSSEQAWPIIEWLSGNACNDLDDVGLVGEIGRRVRAAGLTLDRFALQFRTLHPDLTGRVIAWAPDEPVEVYEHDHPAIVAVSLRDSPFRVVADAGQSLIIRAGEASFPDWVAVDLFENRSLVELVSAPLSNGDAPLAIVTFATRRPGGFSVVDHAFIERILPALRNACELRMLRRVELPLLDTLVGIRTAGRALGAHLRHRAVESIDAAIMLVELADSAEKRYLDKDAVPRSIEAALHDLNSAVAASGGLVLDTANASVLAMFPQELGEEACAAALGAAHSFVTTMDADATASEALTATIALHFGNLIYGAVETTTGHRLVLFGDGFNHLKALPTPGGGARDAIVMSERFAALVRTKKQERSGFD
jgi:adenylate cyclase